MDWYNLIKSWFLKGLWNEEQVNDAAEKGKITEEQAEEIISSKAQS